VLKIPMSSLIELIFCFAAEAGNIVGVVVVVGVEVAVAVVVVVEVTVAWLIKEDRNFSELFTLELAGLVVSLAFGCMILDRRDFIEETDGCVK
jgi:hypothetical protein